MRLQNLSSVVGLDTFPAVVAAAMLALPVAAIGLVPTNQAHSDPANANQDLAPATVVVQTSEAHRAGVDHRLAVD
jgi:hypothetical protein